jgi:hypothetical protein
MTRQEQERVRGAIKGAAMLYGELADKHERLRDAARAVVAAQDDEEQDRAIVALGDLLAREAD